MTDLYLTRHSYAPTETMGYLQVGEGEPLHTMERPWLPSTIHGSVPFKSCIPDGPYDLVPHYSEVFGHTWAMVNPALKVWRKESDMTGPGRYACLIHTGNWVDNVVGCIAPGLGRSIMNGRLAVVSSKPAMEEIRKILGVGSSGHRLIIQPHRGASVSEDG